jgi:hypothetical protein
VVVTVVLYVVVLLLILFCGATQVPAWLAPAATPLTAAKVLAALPITICSSTIVVGVTALLTACATQAPMFEKV